MPPWCRADEGEERLRALQDKQAEAIKASQRMASELHQARPPPSALCPPPSSLRPPPFTLPANPARPAHCPSPLRRAHPSPRTTTTRHPTIDRRGCPLPLRSVLAEVLPVATELLLYSPECADNAADVLRSVCDAIPYHEDTAALQQAFLESYPSP